MTITAFPFLLSLNFANIYKSYLSIHKITLSIYFPHYLLSAALTAVLNTVLASLLFILL